MARDVRLLDQKYTKKKKLRSGSVGATQTITWKLERNANSRTPPRNRESLGVGPRNLCLPSAPRDSYARSGLRGAAVTPAAWPSGEARRRSGVEDRTRDTSKPSYQPLRHRSYVDGKC